MIANTGQSTVTVAGVEVGEPSFEELAEAVFVTDGQLAVVVVERMCTVSDPFAARLTPLAPPQLSTPALIAQVLFQPAAWVSIENAPVFVGSVSDSFTPDAVPGPLLVTVIVNPIP